jgi:lysophospholipid acyltransferase (LPLAT)-like uncharacterized protein
MSVHHEGIFTAHLRKRWLELRNILLGSLAALVIRMLYATIRWERRGFDPDRSPWSDPTAAIFAFWHGRMLMLPRHYTETVRRSQRPKRRGFMLISQHGDGRIIAWGIKLLGISSVSGSSTRGGRAALMRLVREAKGGADIGITPDGPKGPRYVCKSGVAVIAQQSELPVYPCTYSVERCWRVRSWDGMIVPKPFSRGVVILGEPIYIPSTLSVEEGARKIQEALNECTEHADRWWRTGER